MGLYDGRIGTDGFASTAHVADADRRPRSCSSSTSPAPRARSARSCTGMATFDPTVEIAGVILNKAGSPRHAAEVADSIDRLPVLGVLRPRRRRSARRRATSGWCPPPSAPRPRTRSTRLADLVAERDRPRGRADARVAPRPTSTRSRGTRRPRSSAAARRPAAPSSRWPAGAPSPSATPRPRSCCAPPAASRDLRPAASTPRCPEGTAGIYLGGGFPEVHAAGLGENAPLRAELRDRHRRGRPDRRRVRRAALPVPLASTTPRWSASLPADARDDPAADAVATPRSTAPADSLLTRAGETVTGHEFHRTARRPASAGSTAGVDASTATPVGFAGPTLHASYLHVHWAGHPQLAAAVRRCRARSRWSSSERQRASRDRRPVVSRRSLTLALDHRVADPCGTTGTSRSATRAARLRGQRLPRTATALAGAGAARQPRRRRALPARPTPPRPRSPTRHGRPRDEVLRDRRCRRGVHPARPAATLAATGGGAPAVHRAARRARAGRPHGHRGGAARSRLRARPDARPGRRRPGRGRQPDQPDRRAAPGRRPPRGSRGPAGSSSSTRRSWTPSRARPSRSPANAGRPGDPQPDQALVDPGRPRRLRRRRPADVIADLRRAAVAVVGVDDRGRGDPRLRVRRRPRRVGASRRRRSPSWRARARPRAWTNSASPTSRRARPSCWPDLGRGWPRRPARAPGSPYDGPTPSRDWTASWVRIAVRPGEQTQRLLTAAKSWLDTLSAGPPDALG